MLLDEAIETLQPLPAAYVLAGSGQGYLYKGSCRNLVERLRDHRAGRVSRTKNRRPLRLIHFVYYERYPDARRAEAYLKTGAGREFLSRIEDKSKNVSH